jgi:hypothetical protein
LDDLSLHDIDLIIKAELPTDDPSLRLKVKKFMTHGQDHLTRENSRCRKGNTCIYGFPHPITPETWIDDGGRVHYRRRNRDDLWIASHIPELIDELDCHIFVDVVSSSAVFSYLYKYLHKGPDRSWFHVSKQEEPVNEIKDYVEGRYLSSPEAAWRILGFDITSKEPSVTCLPVHLPGDAIPRFDGGNRSENKTTSLLIRYFHRPLAHIFDNLTYTTYFQNYVLYKLSSNDRVRDDEFLEQVINGCVRHKVCQRQIGTKVCRLQTLPPTIGELFYLRCLLTHRPARSFRELRLIDGNLCESYHDAAVALGLFSTENEGMYALTDAVNSCVTPAQLRFLFSRIILEGFPARPLWDSFNGNLSVDFALQLRSEELGRDKALETIAAYLRESGRKLKDFGLDEPANRTLEVIAEAEVFSSRLPELRASAESMIEEMNSDQRHVFNTLLEYITGCGGVESVYRHPYFLEGKPGRGKTFVVDALCTYLRSEGVIVLIVPSLLRCMREEEQRITFFRFL